jgi:hypothetical protein
MKYLIVVGALAALILTTPVVSANPLGGPVSLCRNDNDIPPSIACAGLEVAENGCPTSYVADGEYCYAEDHYSEHEIVQRSFCQDGFEMVGRRCVRDDVGEILTAE